MKVLVAEDTEALRRILSRWLEHYGHEVIAVDNGKDAVDTMSHVAVDAVLMDINMPTMNGLDAARLIRAAESEVPIVGMSDELTGDQWLSAGMSGFLAKPVELSTLLSMIDGLDQLRHKKTGDSAPEC